MAEKIANRLSDRVALPRYQGYFASRRWVFWRNMSDTVCPAFGLIDRAKVYGDRIVDTDGNSLRLGVRWDLDDLYLNGNPFFFGSELSVLSLSHYHLHPDDDEEWFGDRFAANSNMAVLPGKVGLATFDWPFLTIQHPDSPKILAGERCAPKIGSWEVTRESQDVTAEWIGGGEPLSLGNDQRRYDSGRQFSCLGVQREPRLKDRDVLLIAPWRSPQADLLCAIKATDDQTFLTDDGDPFDALADHYHFPETFGLRVPSSPRSGVILSAVNGLSAVSKIRITEPGFYDGVFQATVGMLLKSAYAGYSGAPRDGGTLYVTISLSQGEYDWGNVNANLILPANIAFQLSGPLGQPVAQYAIVFFGDEGSSEAAPFNEDRKRSVYMPFTCRIQRDALLSVEVVIHDAEPGGGGINQYYDATVDNPSLLMEYIGPADSREGWNGSI